MGDGLSLSNHKHRWSEEEDALCSELWLNGVIAREIAERLERSPSAVRSRSQHLNLPQRHVGNHLRNSARISRPPHIRGEETSPEWYECQQLAFVEAMEANPSERPSDIPEERQGHVIVMGLRIPSTPPSWSSMGDCV
jgi:hypothetical protein